MVFPQIMLLLLLNLAILLPWFNGFALGTAAASPQRSKGYSQWPARQRRERPNRNARCLEKLTKDLHFFFMLPY